MNNIQKKQNIIKFINYWQNAQGSEDSECQQFWTDFCRDVLGIENTSKVLDFEKKVQGKSIDVFLENEGILIEQKSRGIDLDQNIKHGNKMLTAYEQAKEYMFLLPRSLKPYWIITCNFDYFRIYNMDEENPADSMLEVKLEDLDKNLYLFDIFTKKEHTKLYKEEQLSYKAGEIVGTLYNKIATLYNNLDSNVLEQKSLNILITRLVFLLYAEDSGLLHETHGFLNYMKQIPANRFNVALKDLFKTLNTPTENRDEYLEEGLNAFPYINGGLFSDDSIIIPPFNETIKTELLLNASQQFDWSGISPTIFGAVFESTLNPETRRSGGMHYTSVENIHKVIDPLFLDDLKNELSEIEGERVQKTRDFKLRQFQNKLASLKILDPAAGSHNFLTETYISLRKLEMRVIENLQGNQLAIIENPIKVNIGQLYAIEINDFAVSVGKTALWIAEQQMMELTQEMLPEHEFKFFPIKNIPNSVCANALKIDWNDVLPSEKCSYVIGNPPFVGMKFLSQDNKNDMKSVLPIKKYGQLDYVSCWYFVCANYMKTNKDIEAALVSTNSICQGLQASIIWKPLFEMGIVINFAYDTFPWDSQAELKANVSVIIISFSYSNKLKKKIYHNDGSVDSVSLINQYLKSTSEIVVEKATSPICKVQEIKKGAQLIDGGGFILNDQKEYDDFISKEINAKPYIYRYCNAKELLNNKISRYCLYLEDVKDAELANMPLVRERVHKVYEYRASNSKPTTNILKNTPTKYFQSQVPSFTSVVLPVVSSERRKYIPACFMPVGIVYTNACFYIDNATLYTFGIVISKFHYCWMSETAGRLESRFRYSKDMVYNTFPWPGVTKENINTPVEKLISEEKKAKIESCAQLILDVRNKYKDWSLADMYDPDKMPGDLREAHLALDNSVEEAYGVDFKGDEEKIISHLFTLYNSITSQ